MIEVTEEEITKLLSKENNGISIFYCYTPLCGTCNLARSMLEEWNKSNSNITIYSVNINFSRTLPLKWQIKSVPYVAIFLNGVKVHEFYRFYSNVNIERQLMPFIKSVEVRDN